MKQILLPIRLDQRATFSSYISGSNAEVVAALRAAVDEQTERQIFLYSAFSRGKSHLLQAICHRAAEQKLTAVYLPLRDLVETSEAVLEGLEQLQIVCLDDVDIIAGKVQWEETLFHCINRIRNQQTMLFMSASSAPDKIGIQLPDLASRLLWGPQYPLHELSDDELGELVLARAAQHGLTLGDDIAAFLISRTQRDPAYLAELVNRMDSAAVEAQRRLTIPFVKKMMAEWSGET